MTAFEPQWPFGHGLSYTRFEYSQLSVDKTEITADQELISSVTIRNTGDRRGTEIVQLYLSDLYASITPAVKKLKGFARVDLDRGESRRVDFKLDRTSFSFIGLHNRPVVEPGQFEIAIGPLKAGFILK